MTFNQRGCETYTPSLSHNRKYHHGLLLVTGDRVDSIDFWSARVRDLEQRITIAREAALEHAPTTSYFVFFNNQKDAAIAAQTNLHAEDGHSFRVMEAPGPEEVRGLRF